MSPLTKNNSIIRRIELAMVVLCLFFLMQFLWLSSLLSSSETKSTSGVKITSSLSANATAYKTNQKTGSSGRTVRAMMMKTTKTKKEPQFRSKEWRDAHWDPGEGLKLGRLPLKISFPVFVASLPKSGTTSMWQYFNCGGHPASHQYVKTSWNETQLTGLCVYKNLQNDRPPFEGCGTTDVFSDTGYAKYDNKEGPLCYYPSMDALEEIYRHYPNVTFIHVERNATSWAKSMMNWGDGSLLVRWSLCQMRNLPQYKEPTTVKDVEAFYNWHNNRIRQFAKEHPSLHYIEVDLESSDTGKLLEGQIGIPASCWGKCTPYSKFCERLSSSKS